MMTVLALFAMAVAPSMQQQAQREREQEAIFRGEQVADAIRDYYRYRAQYLSRRMVIKHCRLRWTNCWREYRFQVAQRTVKFFVASAARDPLTIEGEWRFILPRSEALIDFQQSIMFYTGNVFPPPRDPQMAQLQQFAVPQLVSVINLGTRPDAQHAPQSDDDASGPFVGVASRSQRDSVLTYYGIERHDQWIFTPLFR